MKDFIYSALNVTDILLECYVPAGAGDTVHRNRRSHGLALMTDNSKIYKFKNGPELYVPKNSIVFLPKRSNYCVECPEPGACYAINFDLDTEKTFEPFVFDTKNTPEYIAAFSEGTRCWQTREPGYEMKCKAVLYNILYLLKHEYSTLRVPKTKSGKIQPAVEYIHKNYTSELINISQLAAMCGITPEYFRNLFHSCYGTSPIKYINSLKITRAAELIGSGMCNVSQDAEMSGYTDISYFSREFKKAYGIPPSEYINKLVL